MPRTIIDECKNCKVYDDGTILFQNVRFSYPHLDKPWSKKETEKKKFSLKGLMPQATHKEAAQLARKYILKMLEERNKGEDVAKKDRYLRNGNDGAKAEEKGQFTISSSLDPADGEPSVRGKDTRPIPKDKIKSAIVGGYGGDMLVKPWFQNNDHGKKVNAELVACQLKYDSGPQWEQFGENQRVSEDDIDETFEAAEDDGGFDDDDDDL